MKKVTRAILPAPLLIANLAYRDALLSVQFFFSTFSHRSILNVVLHTDSVTASVCYFSVDDIIFLPGKLADVHGPPSLIFFLSGDV